MFSIQFELDSVNAQARLSDMIDKIEHTAVDVMPVEVVEWQEQDMKRTVPNLDVQGWTVSTLIWPRSRLAMVKRKRAKFGGPTRVARGLRAILRPELFQALRDRMRGMLNIELTWRFR